MKLVQNGRHAVDLAVVAHVDVPKAKYVALNCGAVIDIQVAIHFQVALATAVFSEVQVAVTDEITTK